jgi:hypothetical protein
MKYSDTMGVVYSAAGLRFGGFQMADFLTWTAPLEEARPGVREEIVAEAHYLANWLHRFPEFAFFLGLLAFRSLAVSLLFFVAAYVLEYSRFYFLGPSPFLSLLCRLWEWLKLPALVIAAIILWPTSRVQAATALAFLILRGWLTLGTGAVLLPIRLLLSKIIYQRFSRIHPQIHNTEGIALMTVINAWSRRLRSEGLAPGKGHKTTI